MMFDIRDPVVVIALMIGVAHVEVLASFRRMDGIDRQRLRVNFA